MRARAGSARCGGQMQRPRQNESVEGARSERIVHEPFAHSFDQTAMRCARVRSARRGVCTASRARAQLARGRVSKRLRPWTVRAESGRAERRARTPEWVRLARITQHRDGANARTDTIGHTVGRRSVPASHRRHTWAMAPQPAGEAGTRVRQATHLYKYVNACFHGCSASRALTYRTAAPPFARAENYNVRSPSRASWRPSG